MNRFENTRACSQYSWLIHCRRASVEHGLFHRGRCCGLSGLNRRGSGGTKAGPRLFLDGRDARKLTSHAYRLLSYLIHAGRIISRGEIVEHLYQQDFDRDSNTIEVFVGRLRKKLGVEIIQTARGLGYILSVVGNGDEAKPRRGSPAARA